VVRLREDGGHRAKSKRDRLNKKSPAKDQITWETVRLPRRRGEKRAWGEGDEGPEKKKKAAGPEITGKTE